MSKGSFPIRIYSGLVEPKHHRRIGSAIWLFLLLVDWVTEEKNGEGLVLGGTPINYSRVSERVPLSPRQYLRYVDALRKHGYIKTERMQNGLKVTVLKSKKFPPTSNRNKDMPERADTGDSDMPNMAPVSAKDGISDTPNPAVSYIDSTEDINRTLQSIWEIVFTVFNIPEGSMSAYASEIVDTIQRLGADKTLGAIKYFKRSEEFRPPHGTILSMDDLFKWRKIDRVVAKMPKDIKPKEMRYFYCYTCQKYFKGKVDSFYHCGREAEDYTMMVKANHEQYKEEGVLFHEISNKH